MLDEEDLRAFPRLSGVDVTSGLLEGVVIVHERHELCGGSLGVQCHRRHLVDDAIARLPQE